MSQLNLVFDCADTGGLQKIMKVYCADTGGLQKIMKVYCAEMSQLNLVFDCADTGWLQKIMKVYCADTGGLQKIMKVYCAEGRDTEKIMKVYCAEGRDTEKIMIPPFNILFSYYNSQEVQKYMKFAKNILVDSGAFSLQKKENLTQNEADKYFKSYCKFIETHHENPMIQGFFELDIPKQIGYDQVKTYRDELFEITDKIIPVWHKEYGVNEFKKLTYDYDYISVSCVKHRSIKKEAYPKFVKYSHNNNCKIHGLGLLQEKILNKVPFDSVDGTSWFKMARFGRKNNKKINTDYIYNHQYELTFAELMEHIRFQEKMYRRWRKYHND